MKQVIVDGSDRDDGGPRGPPEIPSLPPEVARVLEAWGSMSPPPAAAYGRVAWTASARHVEVSIVGAAVSRSMAQTQDAVTYVLNDGSQAVAVVIIPLARPQAGAKALEPYRTTEQQAQYNADSRPDGQRVGNHNDWRRT